MQRGGHQQRAPATAEHPRHVPAWPGRGSTTAALAAVAMLVLLVARRYGAGPYGGIAVPFLFLQFLLTGVVAARGTWSACRWLWSPLRAVVAAAVALAATAAAFAAWGLRPSGEPYLVVVFAVMAAGAVLWAMTAPVQVRRGASMTAGASLLALAVAAAARL